MKTYLVTGAAGFIGANYIKYILAKHSDVKVVILDADFGLANIVLYIFERKV